MTTQTGHTLQPTIILTLTAHEAHSLWLAIDAGANTVAKAVDSILRRYTHARKVRT